MDFEFVEALNQQDKMKNWRSAYWKFFNASGRIIGLIFFVGGLVEGACGLILLQNHRIPNTDAWIMVIFSFIVAILGILVVIARPHKPEGTEKISESSKDSSNK